MEKVVRLIFNVCTQNIDNITHFSGLFSGLVFGFIFMKYCKHEKMNNFLKDYTFEIRSEL